jgi:hypothetical protein
LHVDGDERRSSSLGRIVATSFGSSNRTGEPEECASAERD